MTAKALFNEFIKLNRQEKKYFLDQVLNSFVERKEQSSNASSLTKEQIEEITKRITSIKSKTANTYSWEEVKSYAINKNA